MLLAMCFVRNCRASLPAGKVLFIASKRNWNVSTIWNAYEQLEIVRTFSTPGHDRYWYFVNISGFLPLCLTELQREETRVVVRHDEGKEMRFIGGLVEGTTPPLQPETALTVSTACQTRRPATCRRGFRRQYKTYIKGRFALEMFSVLPGQATPDTVVGNNKIE